MKVKGRAPQAFLGGIFPMRWRDEMSEHRNLFRVATPIGTAKLPLYGVCCTVRRDPLGVAR